MGEYVVVFGLGNIGQLTLQIVKNAGFKVIGINLDERTLKLGKENGAVLILNPKDSDIVKEVIHFTDGFGADKVIFTAATQSSAPLHQAFQMARTAFLFPQNIHLFSQRRLLRPFVTGNFSRNLPRGTEESLKRKPIGTRSY